MFTVSRICQILGISKATYYYAKDPQEQFLAKYQQFKSYVEKVIEQNSFYGIRRIKAALKEDYQIIIGRDTLAKLLNLWGLSLRRKIRKPKKSMIRKILIALSDKTNLLIRTKIKRPLQALSSDICELFYQNGKVYLAVHKDVFGQMVYGFKIQETMDKNIVIESFNQAIKTIQKLFKIKDIPKNILIHQDQGSQYTSYEYVDKVLKHARLSYSTPGTPTENPGQESFIGRFKQEWADEILELGTPNQVKNFIAKKIKYYNNKRIHTSINYQAPIKFTNQFIKKFSLDSNKKWFSIFRT